VTSEFKWNLTPTERRIAEAAYANAPIREWTGGPDKHARYAASYAVTKIVNLRDSELQEFAWEHVDAMLAELRSEPGDDLKPFDTWAEVCAERDLERTRLAAVGVVLRGVSPDGVRVECMSDARDAAIVVLAERD